MKERSNKKFYILVAVVLLACAGLIAWVRGPLAKSNVARSGDTVEFTFSGTDSEGTQLQAILDPANAKTNWNKGQVTLGDWQEPVQIEEAVSNHKAGETINDVHVDMPQDYSGSLKQLAGKSVTLNITITEVNRCTGSDYACYPVNGRAKKAYDKAKKEFDSEYKKAMKALDEANKLADQDASANSAKINKKVSEATTAQGKANSSYGTMRAKYDSIKIPELHDSLTQSVTDAETQNNEISTKLAEVKGKAGIA